MVRAGDLPLVASAKAEGTLTFTGGAQIGNFPLNQRSGWTFAGLIGNSQILPAGYQHQVDGSVYLDNPVAAQASTWSAIKGLYSH